MPLHYLSRTNLVSALVTDRLLHGPFATAEHAPEFDVLTLQRPQAGDQLKRQIWMPAGACPGLDVTFGGRLLAALDLGDLAWVPAVLGRELPPGRTASCRHCFS
jgi:hypothetical protein